MKILKLLGLLNTAHVGRIVFGKDFNLFMRQLALVAFINVCLMVLPILVSV